MMNSASQSGNKSFKRNRLPGKNGFKKKNTSYLWQEEKKLNFETLHNPTQQKNDETSSKTQLIFSNMNTHTNPPLTATSRPNARNTYKLIYNLPEKPHIIPTASVFFTSYNHLSIKTGFMNRHEKTFHIFQIECFPAWGSKVLLNASPVTQTQEDILRYHHNSWMLLGLIFNALTHNFGSWPSLFITIFLLFLRQY